MRDYAKRNSRPSKQPSESDGTGILVFLVICTLLFAGYVTYHFTHENVVTKDTSSTVAVKTSLHDKVIKKITEHKVILHKMLERKKPEKTVKVAKKPIQKAAPINPADIQPKYDFYKMLPAMTVSVPKTDDPMLPKALQSTPK